MSEDRARLDRAHAIAAVTGEGRRERKVEKGRRKKKEKYFPLGALSVASISHCDCLADYPRQVYSHSLRDSSDLRNSSMIT
jgi:hypothetical protein